MHWIAIIIATALIAVEFYIAAHIDRKDRGSNHD